ncbi:hypothetical protein IE81DRAFT_325639 [Ceraceosorus guamensis]|uniref:BTB domain-containing protein n=1 Tax=Ceraceosorus guamensis TaxID=1522189 RepID=A0A316VXZ0_9BASI|nr:hypothetical protein IE81DRAFT_325639 [Ceraceosorus guamensis]PWN40345.1 hypothetical protein IE81DRAFT_325639 [Ceraceosorus guamensis]
MQSGAEAKVGAGAATSAPGAAHQNPSHVQRGAPANVLPAYLAFALKSTLCPDLELHAFGRAYPAHRILLAQSPFFRAMLTGGWAEHSQLRPTLHTSSSQPGAQLRLSFDDPHIGRAAFEYCLTSLYGAEPRLVLPSWARPTPTHPLGLAWPPRAVRMPPSEAELEADGIAQCDVQEAASLPDGAHPATPRFLLSLLSTSLYLGIPSISSRALTLILASITPWTLPTYLRYAIGEGVDSDPNIAEGDLDQEIDGPLAGAEVLGTAVEGTESDSFHEHEALDDSAQTELKDLTDKVASTSLSARGSRNASHLESAAAQKEAEMPTAQPLDARSDSPLQAIKKHSHEASPVMHSKHPSPTTFRGGAQASAPATPRQSRALSESALRASRSAPLRRKYDYGPAAARIGEACACWISRWGADVIQVEEALVMLEEQLDWHAHSSKAEHFRDEDHRSALMDDTASSSSAGSTEGVQYNATAAGNPDELGDGRAHAFPPPPKLVFWGPSSHGGVPASWVRGTISADTLCVRGEAERWDLARRVVDLRRGALIASAQRDGSELDVFGESLNTREGDDASPEEDAYESDGSSAVPESDQYLARDAHEPPRRRAAQWNPTRRHAIENDAEGGQDLSAWCDTPDLEAEEAEYVKLFCEGIYYTHMAFAELSKIHQCISPHTGKSYTPQMVLQAAHWAGHELQNRILAAAPPADDPHAGASSPDDEDRDVLGAEGEGNTAQRQAGAGDVTPNAAAAASASSGNAAKKEPATSSLGVSSQLADFERAAAKVESASRASKNKLGTPSRSRFGTPVRSSTVSLPSSPDQHLHLGGLGSSASPGGPSFLAPSGGSGGASAALLRRSFFPVPADDTVRLGDGLGALTSAPNAAAAAAAASAGTHQAAVGAVPASGLGLDSDAIGISTSFNAESWDGPLGLAAAREPSTLTMPSAHTCKSTNVGGPNPYGQGASSDGHGSPGQGGGLMMSTNGNMTATRDAAGFFGTANIVQTGSDLAWHSTRIRNAARSLSAGASSGLRSSTTEEDYPMGHATSLGEGSMSPPFAASPRADAALKSRWTGYEPMRLGVEFYGVDKLAEKQRLYSPTFFYAGSIWNLYCQTLRKPKGLQLGVYLHRQSPSEPLPPASQPPISYNSYEYGTNEGCASAHLTPQALSLINSGAKNVMDKFANAHEALWQTEGHSMGGGEVDETPSIRIGLPSGAHTLQAGGVAGPPSASGGSLSPQPPTSRRASTNSTSSNAKSFLEPAMDASSVAQDHVDLPPIPLFPRSNTSAPLHSLVNGGLGSNAYPSSTGSGSLFPSNASKGLHAGTAQKVSLPTGGSTSKDVASASQSQNPASFLPAPSSPTTPSAPTGAALPALSRSSGAMGGQHVSQSPSQSQAQAQSQAASSAVSMPYRDDRRLLRAFFAIHCPSPLGSALTRFSSGPDQFTVSQSWGWKSSSLLGATFLMDGELGSAKTESAKRFRCVCTIGLI